MSLTTAKELCVTSFDHHNDGARRRITDRRCCPFPTRTWPKSFTSRQRTFADWKISWFNASTPISSRPNSINGPNVSSSNPTHPSSEITTEIKITKAIDKCTGPSSAVLARDLPSSSSLVLSHMISHFESFLNHSHSLLTTLESCKLVNVELRKNKWVCWKEYNRILIEGTNVGNSNGPSKFGTPLDNSRGENVESAAAAGGGQRDRREVKRSKMQRLPWCRGLVREWGRRKKRWRRQFHLEPTCLYGGRGGIHFTAS